MSRILDYVLEPNVVYTNGAFLIKVKVQDDYKYKKYLVSENMKYTTATGTTFTLTNAVSTNNASILQLQGNTIQNGTPTPSSPIEVSTVSGDNEAVVCGKNLLDISNWVKGRINNSTGNIEYAGNVSSMVISDNAITFTVSQAWNSGIASDFIPVTQGTYTYTYSHNREISMYIDAYNSNKTKISRLVSYTQSTTPTTRTFTVDSNTKYIRIHFEVNTANISYEVSNMQLEKGSTATTYELYTGNSYRVDLGGKNLLRYSLEHLKEKNTSGTWNNNVYSDNGLTIKVKEDLSIEINGTSTAQEVFMLNNETMYFKTGTYYLSGCINGSSTTYDIRSYNYDGTSSVLQEFTGKKAISIINNGQGFNIAIVVRSGQTLNNVMFYPMLDKSSVDTQYSPYVSNPIELCKIGSYVDKLKRAEGKNYCYTNASEWELGQYGVNGEKAEFPQRARISTLIPVQPNTTIYVHTNNTNYNFVLRGYGQNKEIITSYGQVTNGNTITTTNVYYLGVTIMHTSDTSTTAGQTILNNIGETIFPMICLNSETNKSYEPYGTNWYIEKNIGKVVLNGSESGWEHHSVTEGELFRNKTIIEDSISQAITPFSNYYKGISSTSGRQNYNIYLNIQISQHWLDIIDNRYTTSADFKTWLTTNNVTVYYVLATPTYEVITNENLIQQLNNIQDIQLIENLCYVDWVGSIAPTMLLQYPTNETLNAYLITEDNKLIRTDWRFIGRRK